jgi:adenylate kinase family enzyme
VQAPFVSLVHEDHGRILSHRARSQSRFLFSSSAQTLFLSMTQDLETTHLARVAVVGSSCAGKTRFARRLSTLLGATHVELDAVYWLKDWRPRPIEEFRRIVSQLLAQDRWVADGNYGVVRDLVWSRATAVVWLNLPLPAVLGRAFGRCVWRSLTREEVFSGNTESFRRSFLSKDSVLLWIVTSFRRRRKEHRQLASSDRFPDIRFLEFRSGAEAESFLDGLQLDRHC